ncbi:MAG: 16S rRNA processing protein RimM [Desulfobacterales bacterium]|nr:16S rRNA processing protein RimM [Desulfobacterales bacterium]
MELISIGKIIGVHGLEGRLKLLWYGESTDIFHTLKVIYLEISGTSQPYEIQHIMPYKKAYLLSLKGIDNREAAQLLVGANLFMSKDNLPVLEENVWYWHDLIGMRVFELGVKKWIGVITEIIRTGSNDVFVIKEDDKECLLPAIQSVIQHVDIETKTMSVIVPEGL